MQQRQLRLGDILDDYCPRERRLTNHAVVAMVGPDVKQTRCTTCDAEHEYKHAKVPRQRRKADAPAALASSGASGGPKRIAHEPPPQDSDADIQAPADLAPAAPPIVAEEIAAAAPVAASTRADDEPREDEQPENEPRAAEDDDHDREHGPVHRPLIRASLPRPEGQVPPARPAPEFTIRQPGGRASRFRPRHVRAGQHFHGNRTGGNSAAPGRNGLSRPGGGRPPMTSHSAKRHDRGRKRSK